jgi:tetratricopeptide (TPR) repeat protein
LNLLGVLSLQRGRFEDAGHYIRKAIEIDSTIAEYHFNLGETLTHQGNKHAAIGSYQQSLRCNPQLKVAQDRMDSIGLPAPSQVEAGDKQFKRHEVIQAVIDCTKAKTYLEIGIDAGESFLNINAERKFGVDPVPTHDLINALLANVAVNYFRYAPSGTSGNLELTLNAANEAPPSIVAKNQSCEFYYQTSDVFFARHAPMIFDRQRIDVAFVDGLHTYHQAYLDVSNVMDFLATGGVILMQGCNPTTEASSFPAASLEAAAGMNLPGWTGSWCGDTWKSIVRLRATRNDLRVFVLDCDYGIGVVCSGEPENVLDMTMPEIERLSFMDLRENRKMLLNLKPQNYLFEFLQGLA